MLSITPLSQLSPTSSSKSLTALMASTSTSHAGLSLAAVAGDDEFCGMLREALSGEEAELFATSFRSYLAHDPRRDFVVDLADVYEWLGYTRKDTAKDVVVKGLVDGEHYTRGQIKIEPLKMSVRQCK